MDVFTKYFRRLVVSHAAQIWHNARADSSGSYSILVGEVQKVSTDPQQAAKIVEAVEFGDKDGDVFKDFDMSTFMDHFQLKTIGKFALASAFKKSSKPDQRAKADGILKNNIHPFLSLIADPRTPEGVDEPSSAVLASIIDHVAQHPPRDWTVDNTNQLRLAIRQRYRSVNLLVPTDVTAALLLFDLLEQNNSLVRTIQRQGSRGTDRLEKCKHILESVELQDIGYQQTANVLLFMAIAGDEPPYNLSNFIFALREHRGGQRLDWQDVIGAFDREGVKITRSQFKRLYDALVPLSREHETFDIQQLWGGDWHHAEAQLAFVSAFLSYSSEELDATSIPRLRTAFTTDDFSDARDDVRAYAASAVRHPLVSLDATRALFNMVFRSSDTYAHAQQLGVIENVINPKMDLFVAAVSAVPKPWGALQDQAIKQLIPPFFTKAVPGYPFVFHILWKRDKLWLAARLKQFYHNNTANVALIFEHAVDHGWLEYLISLNNELSLDLAAVGHGRGLFNMEQWLEELTQSMPGAHLMVALAKFLKSRADDDALSHKEQISTAPVPLAIRTVHALLTFLGDAGLPEDDLIPLQRACIHAYPRLINYGEGFDAIIDSNNEQGLTLSSEADARMQDHYKKMYSSEVQVRDVLTDLERYKNSQDPKEQELFACMIYGLFDEYNCFNEYPNEALAITAVLFGGIVNCNLLSRIALKAALAMVLEAVRDYSAADSMFKFGLQALLHFKDRLSEWRLFSERLLHIPAVRETEIGEVASRVLRESKDLANGDTQNGDSADGVDNFLMSDAKVPEFACLAVDPPWRQDYEEPDEDAKGNIMFTLNNLSERNLENKFPTLKSHLQFSNNQWLANYLVDALVKTQPNNQHLYMILVDHFVDKELWFEVLRETLLCCFKLLNAESTISSSSERTSLKNLADWLGSITLARDRPIKHRNISFRELIIEAHDTDRLALAIPFTCRVLTGASKSSVFRPPCAWTMEIVEILVELHRHIEIKVQHKFEIEKLLNDLDLTEKEVEASDAIRSRPPQDELALPVGADAVDGFGELTMGRLGRNAGRAERFSPSLLPELSEVSSMLKHNYSLTANNASVRGRLQHVLGQAVVKAIQDIIEPVVERSITIAAISASQLISKDFALEPDGQRYENSAHTAVRCLAGNLALVTCKEPLRMNITNNVRAFTNEHFGEHVLTEGNVVMFVNDNLDPICGLIQKAAEGASVNEVDFYINSAVQARKNGNYVEPTISSWSYHVPDPFKPTAGGLNREQLAIYEDFGRAMRTNVAQTANASQEGPRQIPDVLQEQFGSMPNVPATAENAAFLRHGAQQSTGQTLSSQSRAPQHVVNGFSDNLPPQDRMENLHDILLRAVLAGAEEHPTADLLSLTPILQAWQTLKAFVQRQAGNGFAQEKIAFQGAERIVMDFYYHNIPPAAVDALAKILSQLCDLSELCNKEVSTWIHASDDRLSNAKVTMAYLKVGLVECRYVDNMVAPALYSKNAQALQFFTDIVDGLLLNDPPLALRADFAQSMAAFSAWAREQPEAEPLKQLSKKLSETVSLPEVNADQISADRENQIIYMFEEWTRLQSRESNELLPTFLHQLHRNRALASRDDYVLFVRICLESAMAAFEDDNRNRASEGEFLKIDALAKLVVLIVAHQGKVNGSMKMDKAEYFGNMLITLVLLFVKHHMNGVANAQRMFFRMFASIIYELQATLALNDDTQRDLTLTLGKSLLFCRPQAVPSFSFAYLDILAHRLFMPTLLKSFSSTTWGTYCELLVHHINFMSEQVKPFDMSRAAKDLYRGTVELFLVLHHDFPEFLAKHHFQLLNAIPPRCIQLRSLVTSATPSSSVDMAESFTNGFSGQGSDDTKAVHIAQEEVERVLQSAGVLGSINDYLQGTGKAAQHIEDVIEAIHSPPRPATDLGFASIPMHIPLIHALVLQTVLQMQGSSPAPNNAFEPNSPQAHFLDALMEKLSPEPRHFLIDAIVNQLRWPSHHTNYFGLAILHLFRSRANEKLAQDIQMQIARTFLERLVAHRPHAWGLMLTMEELLKNRQYRFWELPFIKSVPEVSNVLYRVVQFPSAKQLTCSLPSLSGCLARSINS